MRKQILNLPKGSLHLIMDIWTSKQKMSVIGIKAQFLQGWKMKQLVLGFRHFSESHTAVNIRELLDTFLDELGMKPDDVNSL